MILSRHGIIHVFRPATNPRSSERRILFDEPPMPHPLETTIRDAYAAFGRGDLDGYLSACTDDFVFNVPGDGAISAVYRGKEGLYDLARKAMEFTAGASRRMWRTCWRTIVTPSFSPGIDSPARRNRKITGPCTFTGFATASWLNAGNIHAIRPFSMTPGVRADSGSGGT